jgi:hypothetical protein
MHNLMTAIGTWTSRVVRFESAKRRIADIDQAALEPEKRLIGGLLD